MGKKLCFCGIFWPLCGIANLLIFLRENLSSCAFPCRPVSRRADRFRAFCGIQILFGGFVIFAVGPFFIGSGIRRPVKFSPLFSGFARPPAPPLSPLQPPCPDRAQRLPLFLHCAPMNPTVEPLPRRVPTRT